MTPLGIHLYLATSTGTASLFARIEWRWHQAPVVTGTDGRPLLRRRRLDDANSRRGPVSSDGEAVERRIA